MTILVLLLLALIFRGLLLWARADRFSGPATRSRGRGSIVGHAAD